MDANPYKAPTTANVVKRRARRRLPLGQLLLGLVIAPIVSGAFCFATSAPLCWAGTQFLNSAFGRIFFGAAPAFSWFRIAEDALASVVFTTVNSIFPGLPALLIANRFGRIRPASVLLFGLILACLWLAGASVTIFLGEKDELDLDFRLLLVAHAATGAAFADCLPMFAGFAAYAWWVRRLEKKLASGASGEA